MKFAYLPLALSLPFLVAGASASAAHGSRPKPPPPPARPDTAGPAAPPGLTGPSPFHPTTPTGGSAGTPTGPSSGGSPATPSGPAGGPATGAPGASGNPATPGWPGGAGASTGDDQGLDPTHWSLWWELNKASYLKLKQRVWAPANATGEEVARLRAEDPSVMRPRAGDVAGKLAPALRAALSSKQGNDLLTGALVALARIGALDAAGDAQTRALFERALAHPNQEVAETAALALGILGGEESLPLLRALLADDGAGRRAVGEREVGYRTRAFAAYGLGLIASHTSRADLHSLIHHELLSTLRADRSSTRDIQVACILGIGLSPLEWVPRAAREPSGHPPVLLGRERQIAELREWFENARNPPLARAHCPGSLAKLCAALPAKEGAEIKRELVELLLARSTRKGSEPLEVVIGCVQALGQLADDDRDPADLAARRALSQARSSFSDQQARNLALIALAEAAARPGNGSGAGSGADEAREELRVALQRGSTAQRPWAGLSLGLLGRRMQDAGVRLDPDFAQPLRAALADERAPDAIGAYAIGLGLTADTESAELLLGRLEDLRDDDARGYCAQALGMIQARASSQELRRLLGESSYRPGLLRDSAIALGLLGDKQALDQLASMMAEARSNASLASLASALGWIGDRRSIDPLLAVLVDRNKTDGTRGFAAVALGLVAEGSELPWYVPFARDANYFAAPATLLSKDAAGVLNIL